jgi:hypothetical protein
MKKCEKAEKMGLMLGHKYYCDLQHRPRILTNIDTNEVVSYRIDGVASFVSFDRTSTCPSSQTSDVNQAIYFADPLPTLQLDLPPQ